MVGKESSTFCGGSCMDTGPVSVPKGNGIAVDMGAGSSGSQGSLVTYKRRKYANIVEDSMTESEDKAMNHLFDQISQKRPHDPMIESRDALKLQRNIVLQQICQSLDSEDGLRKCIQNALEFDPGSCSRTTFKDSVQSCGDGSQSTFQTGSAHDGLGSVPRASPGLTSSCSVSEPSHDTSTITDLCRSTFTDIIMSENFGELCSVILENFQGVKAEKLFDLNCIDSRMKEGVYEGSPMLFYSDIQQMWTKLEKFSSSILSLVKCLMDRTMTSFREKVGSTANSISENGKHEFATQESGMDAKTELREACPIDEVHICRHCGEKIDGRNGLVCDSCEEMYHISCIEPAVKEIPMRSWYCSKCSAKGIESPHDGCIACERLNAAVSAFDCGEDELLYEETEELEESSNEFVENEGGKRFPLCQVCRTEVRNDEDYRICGHAFCPHKFYHVKCLTSKQLISCGSCWYCPSCLCRSCLTDRDDDKIVLCDGCDHAYHIYCMHPPRTTIPRGKWFCTKCDAGIQRLRKAKQSFEDMQNKYKRRALDGNLKSEDGLNKSGGVDMLLNAAKTLNYEENLASMGLKFE